MSKPAHVEADATACIGSGNCADVAPEHFDQRDEDGTVVVLRTKVDPDQKATVEQAIDLCPVAALRLVRPDGD